MAYFASRRGDAKGSRQGDVEYRLRIAADNFGSGEDGNFGDGGRRVLGTRRRGGNFKSFGDGERLSIGGDRYEKPDDDEADSSHESCALMVCRSRRASFFIEGFRIRKEG